MAAARADARSLEAEADSTDPYPPDTSINRPNRPSRMFNVWLTDQLSESQRLARKHHLTI